MVKTTTISTGISSFTGLRKSKNAETIKKHKFIRFMHKEIFKILRICHVRFENNPLSFGDWDRRMGIGVSLGHAFEDNFEEFVRIDNEHYDLKFQKKLNISLKTQARIFQKEKLNGTWTKPRYLTIKNGMSSNRTIADDGWDYLIAIEKQNYEQNIKIAIGIASFTTIVKHIVISSTEQVKVQIHNPDWDYFMRADNFLDEYSDSERETLDREYLRREYENLYDDLTQNRISLNSL